MQALFYYKDKRKIITFGRRKLKFRARNIAIRPETVVLKENDLSRRNSNLFRQPNPYIPYLKRFILRGEPLITNIFFFREIAAIL
jgi:hypothetical protein